MDKCPNCGKSTGALNASPHCPSKTCTWNTCLCGARYDRNTGSHWVGQPPYAGPQGPRGA